MKNTRLTETSAETRGKRLKALAERGDEATDLPDVPELPNSFWDAATVGRFYRPVKRQLTLRLDADVVEWFRAQAKDGGGYQTHINRALRDYVSARKAAR